MPSVLGDRDRAPTGRGLRRDAEGCLCAVDAVGGHDWRAGWRYLGTAVSSALAGFGERALAAPPSEELMLAVLELNHNRVGLAQLAQSAANVAAQTLQSVSIDPLSFAGSL